MKLSAEDQRKVRNVVFHADAFRMSFAIARVTYQRLWRTLETIEPRFKATGTFDDDIASAFSDAWCLVDILHRVRDLAEQSKLVSLREPEVQVFLRKAAPAEALRHHVQHFRSGIHDLPNPSEPLFGSLSWVSPSNTQKTFSIMSGTMTDGVRSYGCTYDRVEQKYCQRLLLAAGDQDFDLEVGVSALVNFGRHLSNHLETKGAKSLIEGPLGLAMTLEAK